MRVCERESEGAREHPEFLIGRFDPEAIYLIYAWF